MNQLLYKNKTKIQKNARYSNKDRIPFVIEEKRTIKTLSIKECREYLAGYKLNDDQLIEIRDNLTAIIDSIINSYLDNFKKWKS